MQKPECRKCGGVHWRFVKCADAPARNEVEERNATVVQLNVQPAWSSDTDRVWGGDRLKTVQRIPGTNTYMRSPDEAA